MKVGCLGDRGSIQGDGNWEGAWLAAYNVNTAGGVTIGNTTYYVGLVSEDTDESAAQLDVTIGVSAANKIIHVDNAQYIVGGFRTEALKSYLEVVMDAKKLFLGTGASTDYFCQNVLDSYNRYKYWFRLMPINSTSLGGETIAYLAYLGGYLNYIYGTVYGTHNVTNVAILRENLDWTIPMDDALQDHLPLYGFNIVKDIAYPITATADDFQSYMTQIKNAGADIIIPIISAQGGIYMMQKYAAVKPNAVVAGIDVQSQSSSFWDDSNGACQYETVMQPLTRTNKTSLSIAYWDQFIAQFGHSPQYTATGAYDAIHTLVYAINKTQSFNEDTLVAAIQNITASHPLKDFSVSSPEMAFTKSHDVKAGWPYGVTLFAQWQKSGTGGRHVCVPDGGYVYPDSLVQVNDTYQIPSWVNASWTS
ncbi:MAG: ABC transporter substrate-binding protein [Candidatus Lokiarchaeota archaeon]